MKVFHFLANVLKDEPLFDSPEQQVAEREGGAVYNDFDHNPMELLAGDENAFSYSQLPSKATTSSEAVQDHAVMAVDTSEDLTWNTELFDNYTEKCNSRYSQKVYKLVTNAEGCWDALSLTGEARMVFARRHRTNWDQPDTVYDAWLLRRGLERSWFDNHTFFDIMYPELKEGELGSPGDGSDEEDLEAIPCYQQPCEDETRSRRVGKRNVTEMCGGGQSEESVSDDTGTTSQDGSSSEERNKTGEEEQEGDEEEQEDDEEEQEDDEEEREDDEEEQ